MALEITQSNINAINAIPVVPNPTVAPPAPQIVLTQNNLGTTIDNTIPSTANINSTTLGTTVNAIPTTTADTTLAKGFLPLSSDNPTIGKSPESAAAATKATKANATPPSKTTTDDRKIPIDQLEKDSKLNEKELKYLKNHKSNPRGIDYNGACYYLMLVLLVYGFDFKTLTAALNKTENKGIIDKNFINDFLGLKNDKHLDIKKTPAYKMGCFDETGCFGVTHGANAGNQPSNPITGAPTVGSSLVTDLLDKIHPGATAELVSFCNKIRTHAWLSLPKGSFGSLSRIIAKIQGAIEAFETIISDLYQGCIQIVQKMYAALNGVIAKAQKTLLNAINKIIPLDLLCLILETLQVLMDDINFFTSLFQMSGPFLNYLNTFQNVLNTTSNLVSNPFSAIQSFLPPEVNNIIDMVNQIGSDPNGFLADKLNNYGYGYVLNALQGNLVAALVNKYGAGYASITPLGNILSKGSAIYSHFGGQFPAMPATMVPNIYTGADGRKTDAFGNQVGSYFDTLDSDFNSLGSALSGLGSLPSDFKALFGDISNTANNVGTSIKNTFTGAPSPAQ